MKEIKFIAWNPALKRFSEPFGVGGSPHYPTMPGGSVSAGQLDGKDIQIYCQYTGVKDQHGREIYEGHIVSYKDNLHGQMKYKVHFETAEMMNSGLFNTVIAFCGCTVPKDCIIIGHALQNTELLP